LNSYAVPEYTERERHTMKKHTSSRLTGRLRDGLIVGVAVATAVLAGLAGSAFADGGANGATREFANHISQHNATFKR